MTVYTLEEVIPNYPKTTTYKVVTFKKAMYGHEEGHVALLQENNFLKCGDTCGVWCYKDDPDRKYLEVIDEFTEWTPRVGDIVMDIRSENTTGETYSFIGEVMSISSASTPPIEVQFGDRLNVIRIRNKDELVYLGHIDEGMFKAGDYVEYVGDDPGFKGERGTIMKLDPSSAQWCFVHWDTIPSVDSKIRGNNLKKVEKEPESPFKVGDYVEYVGEFYPGLRGERGTITEVLLESARIKWDNNTSIPDRRLNMRTLPEGWRVVAVGLDNIFTDLIILKNLKKVEMGPTCPECPSMVEDPVMSSSPSPVQKLEEYKVEGNILTVTCTACNSAKKYKLVPLT